MTIKIGLALTLIGLRLISIPDNHNYTGGIYELALKYSQRQKIFFMFQFYMIKKQQKQPFVHMNQQSNINKVLITVVD